MTAVPPETTQPFPTESLGPPPAGPPPAPKASGWRSWAVAMGVTVVVVAVGALVVSSRGGSKASNVSANAASASNSTPGAGNGFGGGARGTVTKIDGSTLTVDSTDRNGVTSTVSVDTSAQTTFTKVVSGTVGDIKVGDNVLVTGDGSSSSGVTATSITDNGTANGNGFGGPRNFGGNPPSGGATGSGNGGTAPQGAPPQQAGGFAAGTVASVNGSTLTVTSFDGSTVTVSTTAQTTVNVTKDASFNDIKVGDTISANGSTNNSVVTATTVRIGALPFGRFGPGAQGAPGATPTDNGNGN